MPAAYVCRTVGLVVVEDGLVGPQPGEPLVRDALGEAVEVHLHQGRATPEAEPLPVGRHPAVAGIENLTGSIYDDVLLGNGANNVLMGGVGVDVLAGL